MISASAEAFAFTKGWDSYFECSAKDETHPLPEYHTSMRTGVGVEQAMARAGELAVMAAALDQDIATVNTTVGM